jgi:hypothetical protein
VDSATHDMVAQCGTGGKPRFDLLSTHTRLWCRPDQREWCEPVDLPLLLSQTKYNWSLVPVEADVDSATLDMVAQCGLVGKPRLSGIRGCSSADTLEYGMCRLVYIYCLMRFESINEIFLLLINLYLMS